MKKFLFLTALILSTALSVLSQCNVNPPVKYILTANSGADIYYPTGNSLWKGGDTLEIASGVYGLIELDSIKGDVCNPIHIRCQYPVTCTFQFRIKHDSKYLDFDFRNAGGFLGMYGLKVYGGPVTSSLAHHIKFYGAWINGHGAVDNGFLITTPPDIADRRTYYDTSSLGAIASNYVNRKWDIGYCRVDSVRGEAMYVGKTDQDGSIYGGFYLIPIRMDSVRIHHMVIRHAGWDGIQLANARNGCSIDSNDVYDYGYLNLNPQQAGIILGGNTAGKVFSNVVRKGTGNGIQLFGYGNVLDSLNVLDSCGRDGTSEGQQSILSDARPNNVRGERGINAPQVVTITNDTINHPMPRVINKGGLIQVYYDIADPLNIFYGPGKVKNNVFCVPGASGSWQTQYLKFDIPGTTNTNNTLYCKPPTANAGTDITLLLPINSTTLSGSGTSSQATINSYHWNKLSGPAGSTLTSPNSASTAIGSLVQGVYKFELIVTDNASGIAKDTIQVTVLFPAVNTPPFANAGSDIVITIPTTSTTLSGSGSDADGVVFSFGWAQVSGPSLANIANPATSITNVSALLQGVYVFRLSVTDNGGAVTTDDVQVTVNPGANVAPTADAGSDIVVVLPTNTATLAGSGIDPDTGFPLTYRWTKISGPAGSTITGQFTATANIGGLKEGTYVYQLTVTDVSGATGTATMQVIVMAAPLDICTITPLNNIILTNDFTGYKGMQNASLEVSQNDKEYASPGSQYQTTASVVTWVYNPPAPGKYNFRSKITMPDGRVFFSKVQTFTYTVSN